MCLVHDEASDLECDLLWFLLYSENFDCDLRFPTLGRGVKEGQNKNILR